MISRYIVLLNDIPLESVSPSILIHDVKYPATSVQDATYTIAKRDGARIARRYIGSTSVTVEFEIHEYDISRRQAVCGDIVRWAKNGGNLEVNDRQFQFLDCVCSKFPSIESVRDWTDTLEITFTAYVIPYWQEKLPSTITLTGTSESESIHIPGNADGALVEATIKANASVSSVTIGVNGMTMILSSLGLSANDIVTISYDEYGILRILKGNTSILDKRSGVDDLLAKCGESNTFSVSASASVDVTFSVRGLWL